MDKQTIIEKIIYTLGLPSMSMDKFFPDVDKIITKDTLVTFSNYFPYVYRMNVDLSNVTQRKLSGGWVEIFVKDQFLEDNNLPIISIVDATPYNTFSTWNSPVSSFNVEAMILEGEASNIRSLLNVSDKGFEFRPPNIVRLKNYTASDDIVIDVKTVYPNIGAVPMSVMDQFEKLAKLDVKCWLYPQLKLYNRLETAEGTIDLKIDDWADAPKERDDLLSEWLSKNFPYAVNATGYHRKYE